MARSIDCRLKGWTINETRRTKMGRECKTDVAPWSLSKVLLTCDLAAFQKVDLFSFVLDALRSDAESGVSVFEFVPRRCMWSVSGTKTMRETPTGSREVPMINGIHGEKAINQAASEGPIISANKSAEPPMRKTFAL